MEKIPDKSIKTYWQTIWEQFKQRKIGMLGLVVLALFTLIGIYAPFLASSKPIVIYYDNQLFFPLFRYLFFTGFYTKNLDIFFNLLIFTFPLFILGLVILRHRKKWMKYWALSMFLFQCLGFICLIIFPIKDPASDPQLTQARQTAIKNKDPDAGTFAFTLKFMNDYAKLNSIMRFRLRQEQDTRLKKILKASEPIPTLWQTDQNNEILIKDSLKNRNQLQALEYIETKHQWLEEQNSQIRFILMPLISHFHWEDDAGGSQALNHLLPFWELTRVNRKDLTAALIFGVRVSLVVGIIAVTISLLIGVPIGAIAGFFGGKTDIIISRFLEIWETMPAFLMLLMVVAIAQNKSIFLVISVIGLFGWTGFSRYIRAEFFKQRNLSYVEACQCLGFSNTRIIFRHILPNAIPPILTLLPFAVMGAVSSEAGLSFLGLGEEGSCSWGVLMDEGRSAFPGESYLLWPPAILLTTLLIAAALVGDALRDAFDPKMHRSA